MTHATTLVHADLADLLRRAARELSRAWPDAQAGDVRGVHRARVASRRLREALPVAGDAASCDVRALRRRLRRVTRALGRVRETDVARGLLVSEAARRAWPASLVARVDRRCAADREDHRRAMLARVDAPAIAAMGQALGELADAVTEAPVQAAPTAHLATRIRRRARTLAGALDHAGTLYEPETLHAVRIAAKKLRYALELAHGAARLPVGRDLTQLRQLQERLGALHDLQMLQQAVQTVAAAPRADRSAARRLESWIAQLEAECRDLHAAFVQRVPRLRALVGRLEHDVPLRLVAPQAGRMAAPRPARIRRRKESVSS